MRGKFFRQYFSKNKLLIRARWSNVKKICSKKRSWLWLFCWLITRELQIFVSLWQYWCPTRKVRWTNNFWTKKIIFPASAGSLIICIIFLSSLHCSQKNNYIIKGFASLGIFLVLELFFLYFSMKKVNSQFVWHKMDIILIYESFSLPSDYVDHELCTDFRLCCEIKQCSMQSSPE